jgi:signal transduction histidine kinase
VCLDYTEDALVVTVADDGRGMSRDGAGAGRSDPGLGLRGMDERTKLLRGALTIRSDVGEGTELSLVVPYSDDPDDGSGPAR